MNICAESMIGEALPHWGPVEVLNSTRASTTNGVKKGKCVSGNWVPLRRRKVVMTSRIIREALRAEWASACDLLTVPDQMKGTKCKGRSRVPFWEMEVLTVWIQMRRLKEGSRMAQSFAQQTTHMAFNARLRNRWQAPSGGEAEESSPCETLQVIVAGKAVCSIDRRELTEPKPILHHLRCNLPAVAMWSLPPPIWIYYFIVWS